MNLTLTQEQITQLKNLAQVMGIQTTYRSAFGTDIDSEPDAIAVALGALTGEAVTPDFSNLDAILKHQTQKFWSSLSEPSLVAWEKKPIRVPIRIPASLQKKGKAVISIKLESGKKLAFNSPLAKLPTKSRNTVDGVDYVELELALKKTLPFGYHRGTLQVGKVKHSFFLISAPWKTFKPKKAKKASLGIFAPLYALHSQTSWGMGDFTDLNSMLDWAYARDCDFVGTLPMLSIFTDKPMVEPSPYAPLSRVFWNELYVDPRKTSEWKLCKEAQELTQNADFVAKVDLLQKNREVDYQAIAQLKRPVMAALAEYFFTHKGEKSSAYKDFLKIYPAAEDYAAFRATNEKLNKTWREWPEAMKQGTLKAGDYNESDKQFHLYCQFQAHIQLSQLSTRAAKKGNGIYIDFPLSAHADGYDVWRDRDSFAQVVSAGCPPDPAHVHGQDWGILALNPQSIRHTEYGYFRRCLESHMRYAGMLRLDHVMCFYRLYWVPHGLGAKKGVYVRYKMDEFFALLVLESHRNGCVLIGEDLGTVPPEIREAMTEHGILRMYVQQRKLTTTGKDPLPDLPENAICSLNTHDMPPFAAFWEGLDIIDKMNLGYFGPEELDSKKKARDEAKAVLVKYLVKKKLLKTEKAEFRDILKAMLKLNAKNKVKVMQINLEDLWQETLPQNVPGTWKERPNWKRRCKHSLDELLQPNQKSNSLPLELKDLEALFKDLIKLRRKAF